MTDPADSGTGGLSQGAVLQQLGVQTKPSRLLHESIIHPTHFCFIGVWAPDSECKLKSRQEEGTQVYVLDRECALNSEVLDNPTLR